MRFLYTLFFIYFLSHSNLHAGKFYDLEELPGANIETEPTGLSGDGSTVIGYSSTSSKLSKYIQRAFYWTKAEGMQEIPLVSSVPSQYDCILKPGTDVLSRPTGVNDIGDLIYGAESRHCKPDRLGRRKAAGYSFEFFMGSPTQSMPDGGPAIVYNPSVFGLSGDGRTAVGVALTHPFENHQKESRPWTWTHSEGFNWIVNLADDKGKFQLGGYNNSKQIMSYDGEKIGGSSFANAAIYNLRTGKIENLKRNSKPVYGYIRALSADGQKAIVFEHKTRKSLIWSSTDGWSEIEGKCDQDGYDLQQVHAVAITDAGRVSGGVLCTPPKLAPKQMDPNYFTGWTATMWEENGQIVFLNTIFQGEKVKYPTMNDWTLRIATHLSFDGSVLAGTARDKQGNFRGWYYDTRE